MGVWLSNSKTLDKILDSSQKNKNLSKLELIETLCPSIDCNIYLEEKGKSKLVTKANDWISISPLKFVKRIIGNSFFNKLSKDEKELISDISKNLRLIKDDKSNILGRGLIYREEYKSGKKEERLSFNGVVTVGGMKTTDLSGLLGIFIGTSYRASRDIGIPIAKGETISKWATEQANLLASQQLNNETQVTCASIIRACGGQIGELNFAFHKTGLINYPKLKELISITKKEEFLIIWKHAVGRYEKDHNCKVDLFDNVFAVDGSVPGIMQTRNSEHFISWPKDNWGWFHSKSLHGIIIEAISECWGIEVTDVLNQSNISSDYKSYSASIGKANGKDVIEDNLDVMKKRK